MRSEPGRIKYLLGLSVGLIGLLGCSLVFYAQPLWAEENQNGRAERTWKTLAELSEEERSAIDMAHGHAARCDHPVSAGRSLSVSGSLYG